MCPDGPPTYVWLSIVGRSQARQRRTSREISDTRPESGLYALSGGTVQAPSGRRSYVDRISADSLDHRNEPYVDRSHRLRGQLVRSDRTRTTPSRISGKT